MNRILLLAAIALVAGCSPGIKGDGVIVTTNAPISEFSVLEVSGAYKIKWSPGKPALSISTDQNLLPLITMKVAGNTLEIDQQQNLRPTKGITVNVSSASLGTVRLNGAVSLTASNVSAQDLKLECNGACSIRLDGSVTNLKVSFSGASSLSARSLRSQTARIELNGASSVDVTVSESLDASISGAGSVTYGGNPKTVEQKISGVGRIQSRP